MADKVNVELEQTLEMAVKDRMQTAELYKSTLQELQTKNREYDTLAEELKLLQQKSARQEQDITQY